MKKVTVRLHDDIHREVACEAARERRSLNSQSEHMRAQAIAARARETTAAVAAKG